MKSKTSLFKNGLIWFGAGISIAEIISGTYFAPLGMAKGFLAVLTGHVIGCGLFFLAALIGGKSRRSAMGTVGLSFGSTGARFFAILNIMQLLGWTAIMISDGAAAAGSVLNTGTWIWALVIGALIILWIAIGIKDLGYVNTVAMAALFILTVVLCITVFGNTGTVVKSEESISFGAAVELAAAMPLSWLPLAADYTKDAEKPAAASAVSAVIYGLVSMWMYTIGMASSIFTGESEVASIMLKAGLSIGGIVIIILSTVTTTFLDAFSAGISAESLSSRINGKAWAIAVAACGTVLAIIFPMENITDFLYLIGSVFCPMAAIQIADFFLLGRRSEPAGKIDWQAMAIWLFGFICYRFSMNLDIVTGNTLPVIAAVMLVTIAVRKIFGRKTLQR